MMVVNTMGTVRVACCTARKGSVLLADITSGVSASNSAAAERARSSLEAAQR